MEKLTKDQILSKDDLPSEKLFIPEWDLEVNVMTMTGRERDRFETDVLAGEKAKNINIRALLCVRCIGDENKIRIFSDSDALALGEKSAAALDRVFDVAQRLNGIGEHDIKELEKKSESAPT